VACEADHRSVQSDVNCSRKTPFSVVGYVISNSLDMESTVKVGNSTDFAGVDSTGGTTDGSGSSSSRSSIKISWSLLTTPAKRKRTTSKTPQRSFTLGERIVEYQWRDRLKSSAE